MNPTPTPGPGQTTWSPVSSQDERSLVDQLTTVALSEHLPEELDIYLAGRQQYLDQRGTIPPSTTKEESTGFGAEILVALTPYFVAAATAAVKYVVGLLGDALKDEAKPLITTYVRKLFHLADPDDAAPQQPAPQQPAPQLSPQPSPQPSPQQPVPPVPPVPPDMIGRVHAVVIAFCHDHQLGESDSVLVADAIAGRLALPA